MRALALTFDDGPDCRYTPILLDLLGEARATATFFVIAPRAAAQPELIDRALREGHAVWPTTGSARALRQDAEPTVAYTKLVIDHARRSGMALRALA